VRGVLVLPAALRFRCPGGAGAVQPLERDVGRGAVLRQQRVHEPQGYRVRLDHAASGRHPARAASGADGGVAGQAQDERAGGDDGHVSAAAGGAAGAGDRRRRVLPLLDRGGREPSVDGRPVSAAARAVLEGAVDYAGLFPPAGLGMAAAVANYRRYRAGADAWALGRFVCPAARLEEFARELEEGDRGIEISATAPAGGTAQALEAVQRFHQAEASCFAPCGATQDKQAEARPSTSGLLRGATRSLPRAEVRARVTAFEAPLAGGPLPTGLETYWELDPASAEFEAQAMAVKAAGDRAKLRTGGVQKEAIPSVEQVLRF